MNNNNNNNEEIQYQQRTNMNVSSVDNNDAVVSNENQADEFDQAELEKLSEKEVTDTEESTNRNSKDDDLNDEDKSIEDIIPNAIVIKNIPFAIKKEQLLDIIDEMNLPLPYAFNYHFDNGIFRGLAFANFTTAEETLDVITNLNGKEINGRKLKVEYKKMLPQAERERIEREKREKRGQLEEQHRNISNLSLHSLGKMSSVSLNQSNNLPGLTSNMSGNTTQNNGNSASAVSQQIFSTLMNGNKVNNNGSMSSPSALAQQTTSNSYYSQKSNQYQYQSQPQQQIPPFGYNQNSGSTQNLNSTMNQSGNGNTNNATSADRYYAPLPSSSTVPIPPQQLDFNDPDTLEIYSQLLLFRDREKQYSELAYPIGLSGNYKRVINVLCSYLNLIEVYDPRFVVIKRKFLDQASLQSHLQQQGQMPTMHPLQPNSTGGSLNRSHSYTSLLQAHASAAAAAASNNNNNDNSSVVSHGSSTMNLNGTASLLAQTAAAQQAQSLSRGYPGQNQSVASPNPGYTSSFYSNDQGQGSNPSLQSPLLSNPNGQSQQSQTNSSSQSSQQQQAFLRQPNPLAPSARIPSGYSSNTQLLNSTNPLLRNSGMTNTVSSPQSSTTHRILSSLHNNAPSPSPSQLHDQIIPNATDNNPLLQQNTSGSVQSNFSSHSFHDDPSNILQNANNNSNADIIYGGTSGIGLDSGLEHHLSRSLSGLDVTGIMNNNVNNNSSTNVKRSMW